MQHDQIAAEWFALADADLASAQFLQKMRPAPIEIICYHCQQGAEKYLKGFLAAKGAPIAKTHDLPELNAACAAHDVRFEKIADDCLVLTDYGVNIRYPFHLDLNAADMKDAIKRARKIQRFVRKVMK